MYLFQINPRMAWLSGFADKAETFLNQIDRGAADVLNTSNQGCIFCPQTLKLPQKHAERMLKILIFAPILCYFCQALVYF